jgi:acyl-CoA synthetase (AMP-forming)/AMP-acid ligase II
MAAHLKHGLGVKPGDTVAMLAKNSVHFIMAELAIWMAGGPSWRFPTGRRQRALRAATQRSARAVRGQTRQLGRQQPASRKA